MLKAKRMTKKEAKKYFEKVNVYDSATKQISYADMTGKVESAIADSYLIDLTVSEMLDVYRFTKIIDNVNLQNVHKKIENIIAEMKVVNYYESFKSDSTIVINPNNENMTFSYNPKIFELEEVKDENKNS